MPSILDFIIRKSFDFEEDRAESENEDPVARTFSHSDLSSVNWSLSSSECESDNEINFSFSYSTSFITTKKPCKKKKHVSFSESCTVILIPSRKEYFAAGIDIWYSQNDQHRSQTEFCQEVSSVLKMNPALNYEMALTFLYQPTIQDQIEFVSLEKEINTRSISLDADSSDVTDCSSASSEANGCLGRYLSVDQFDQKGKSRIIRFQNVPCFSDTKEKLDVLYIDRHYDQADEVIKSVKENLQVYNKWVMTFKHCISFEEALIAISSATNRISKFDVILIDDSLVAVSPKHKESSKLSMANFMTRCRSAYGKTVLIGYLLNDSISFDSQTHFVEDLKTTTIDFIWKKPLLKSLHMLPLLLSHQVYTKKTPYYAQHIPTSPTKKAFRLRADSLDSYALESKPRSDLESSLEEESEEFLSALSYAKSLL